MGCERIKSVDMFGPQLEKELANSSVPAELIVPVDYQENMKLTVRLGKIILR